MSNRLICTVFSEMRSCVKTHNFSYLPGLIEEAQSMANRMESALYDKHDIETWAKESSEARKEIRKLREELDILSEERVKRGGDNESR